MSNMKYISDDNLNWLIDALNKETGIFMSPEKKYLVETKLMSVLKKHDISSIEEAVSKVRYNYNRAVKQDIFDALTTNETSFFRDRKPFEFFEKHSLPKIMERNKVSKRIKIWSAACSSGQEAYSLAIIMNGLPELNDWDIEIIGTDISQEIVSKAKAGIYSQFEVQRGMPTKELLTSFEKEGNMWRIKKHLKKNIRFETGNILQPKAHHKQFDIVYCRNVLIYFEKAAKQRAVNNITNALKEGGELFVGGAETVMGLNKRLVLLKPYHGLYEKI